MMQLVDALIGSMETMNAVHNAAASGLIKIQGRESASASDVVTHAELDALFAYWSPPARAALVRADSWKIPFSCAVDAVIDSDFVTARVFVRTGAFLRDWAEHGGARMRADLTSPSYDPETVARYEETRRALWKTRTDRGIGVYLAKQLPCRCLGGVAREARATPETGKCATCESQLPKARLKVCARCGAAEYCSRACQKADWKSHKRVCRAANGTD